MEISLTIRMKVAKMGNSLRMTIPVDVARALNLNPGDYVDIGVVNGTMTVKKTHVGS